MKVNAIITQKDGKHWQPFSHIHVTSLPSQLTLDPSKTYQKHLGIGGAITEATAFTSLANIDPALSQKIIDLYYGADGLRYNWTRIAMNSSDFSLGNYDYVAYKDTSLSSFNIEREKWYTLPFLKRALAVVPDLNILISPWSPPGWMKSNGAMNHGGKLLPEYYDVWAQYYVKFIQALQQEGISPWGITIQNEPAAKQVWDSCEYTAEEEYYFLKHHLGPAIQNAFANRVNILVWDHNRDVMPERVKPIYDDPDMKRMVWGAGFHWYGQETFHHLSAIHHQYPDYHLLFTEGCIEGGPKPLAWHTADRYARNMIEDFNHFNEGFIDWNMVLNEQGGPNHVGNFCDAPILYDRRNQQLIINYTYAVIGHFSRHIPPGSYRIHHEGNVPEGLRLVSYQTPDHAIVLVILNSSQQTIALTYTVLNETLTVQCLSDSIITVTHGS
jgi:glucosylceramidase